LLSAGVYNIKITPVGMAMPKKAMFLAFIIISHQYGIILKYNSSCYVTGYKDPLK
jgi:hypothetical protein